jgi:acyl carrier protein
VTEKDIAGDLSTVFREFFDDESIHLTSKTTANDIEAWDSFANIGLLLAVEKKFKIRFTTIEIDELKSVGDLLDLIERKRS